MIHENEAHFKSDNSWFSDVSHVLPSRFEIIRNWSVMDPWSLQLSEAAIGGFPQKDSRDRQYEGERSEKRVRDLQSYPEDDWKELGSLLFSLVATASGMFIGARGRWRGSLTVGILLVIWGILGLLLGFDLWSLARHLRWV
jgi:hypothetical protein